MTNPRVKKLYFKKEKKMAKTENKVADEAVYDDVVAEMEEATGTSTETAAEPVVEDSKEEETPQSESETSETPQYTEEEQHAINQGWKPKDQFTGDSSEWIPAREFNKNGEFIDVIKNQSKKIKKLEDSMQSVVDLNTKLYKSNMQEKANEVLEAKRLAIQNGNVEEAEQLEDKFHEMQKETGGDKSQPAPEAVEFQRRNHEWFNDLTPENAAMRSYAVQKEVQLQQTFPDWSDGKRLLEVEKITKKYFKIGGENVNRSKPTAVNVVPPENSSLGKAKKKFTFNMLPSHMKQEVRTIATTCNMELDEYANQLHEMGEV